MEAVSQQIKSYFPMSLFLLAFNRQSWIQLIKIGIACIRAALGHGHRRGKTPLVKAQGRLHRLYQKLEQEGSSWDDTHREAFIISPVSTEGARYKIVKLCDIKYTESTERNESVNRAVQTLPNSGPTRVDPKFSFSME